MKRHKKSLGLGTAAIAAIGLGLAMGPANANHSWANYHWPLSSAGVPSIDIRYNVNAEWLVNDPNGSGSYLDDSIENWENPRSGFTDYFDFNVTQDGGLGVANCTPGAGEITYCSDHYGDVGWLGIAGIYAGRRDGHITQGYVKLNDSYYDDPYYDTASWRALVACQEVGHTFGLGHQNENFSTDLTTSCMEYTNRPGGNEDTDDHDWEQLTAIYEAHLAEGSGGGGKPSKGGGGGGGGGKPDKNRNDIAVAHADAMAFREVGQIAQANPGDHPVFGTPIGYDNQGRPNVFMKLRGNSQVEIIHVTWAIGFEPDGTDHDGHSH